MTLGQKIKELRTSKSLTQKDLADKLHVSFQTVSKWENGDNEPDIATLKELATLFSCSVDYLVGSDNEGISPAPQEKTVVIHQSEPHVCAKCGKDIAEEDLVSEDASYRVRQGRDTRTVSTSQTFYHKQCFEEVKKEREETATKKKVMSIAKAKKLTIIWSIVGGVVAFAIALAIFLVNMDKVNPGLGVLFSVLIGYGIFSMLYCIISGSYIADVFLWCSSLSIRFPGLIFSWDIEGFIWVIAMKILFAVLGFLIGVFALIFAILFSATLGMFSFPFVLVHNIRTNYMDSLFMPITPRGGSHRRSGRRR